MKDSAVSVPLTVQIPKTTNFVVKFLTGSGKPASTKFEIIHDLMCAHESSVCIREMEYEEAFNMGGFNNVEKWQDIPHTILLFSALFNSI